MAVVELTPEAAYAALAGQPDGVTIAGVNGPRSVILSGDRAALTDLVAAFQAQSIFARLLAVDVAAHSPQLDSLLPALHAQLADLQPQTGTLPFYSTVTGQLTDGAELDGAYWARNLRAAGGHVRAGDLAELVLDVEGVTARQQSGPGERAAHGVTDLPGDHRPAVRPEHPIPSR